VKVEDLRQYGSGDRMIASTQPECWLRRRPVWYLSVRALQQGGVRPAVHMVYQCWSAAAWQQRPYDAEVGVQVQPRRAVCETPAAHQPSRPYTPKPQARQAHAHWLGHRHWVESAKQRKWMRSADKPVQTATSQDPWLQTDTPGQAHYPCQHKM
jgi:hypothetical protein